MTHPWDDFSKSLAEPVPRRESLRRVGAVLAGAVLGPLGTARAAPKGKPPSGKDPCQTFCKCRDKAQQHACLAACHACGGDTRRLCGACGSYVCCGNGQTCCANYCADLANDVYNCGACGSVCAAPGPYEYGSCINGRCVYECVEGAVRCNGTCTFLDSDPDNCGACGYVCGESTPYCSDGLCTAGDEPCPGGGTRCDGVCTNLSFDTLNCGGCGIRCAAGQTCSGGVCQWPF